MFFGRRNNETKLGGVCLVVTDPLSRIRLLVFFLKKYWQASVANCGGLKDDAQYSLHRIQLLARTRLHVDLVR